MALLACAVVLSVATSGRATPGRVAAAGSVIPLLDCVAENADGSFYAVIGYANGTSQQADVPYGPDNRVDASGVRQQPTTFEPGTRHGVFALHVPGNAPTPSWTLNGSRLSISAAAARSCSPADPPPASDSIPGPVMGLVATGLVVWLVRRAAAGHRAAAGYMPPDAGEVYWGAAHP